MAVLSQCFSYYCCMESLGKLPPIRFGHHMADVSAILRIFSGAGRRRIQAAAATPHGEQEPAPATPATTLRSLFQKEKHTGSQGKPVAGVARAAPGVAGRCPGGPSEAAGPAGTNTSAAPRLCRLSPDVVPGTGAR